jgi:hypothetical protein
MPMIGQEEGLNAFVDELHYDRRDDRSEWTFTDIKNVGNFKS